MGAELELLSGDTQWLDRVKFITIETHDCFRPGSDGAVRGRKVRPSQRDGTLVARGFAAFGLRPTPGEPVDPGSLAT